MRLSDNRQPTLIFDISVEKKNGFGIIKSNFHLHNEGDSLCRNRVDALR